MDPLEFWDQALAPSVELLRRDSWDAWKAALRALFGLPMSDTELDLYRQCTGRESPPEKPAREGWYIVGRRGGKSYVMALVALYLATVRRYDLAPGERGVLMIIASDRRQARVVRRYIGALLEAVPMLARLVQHDTQTRIELSTDVDIEIHTASFRSVRGYTVVGAILDEIAFFPTDDAADPDREILAALRPAMATTGGLLLAISTPYARRGELYRAWRSWHGIEGTDVLVWTADTATMNPEVPESVIARAFEEDEAAAWSEYGRDGVIRFRKDVESFVSRDALESATVPNRRELPPVDGVEYVAFVDLAGGSGGDSATVAVAHVEERDGEAVAVLDMVREVKPPFSPNSVCADFAAELKRYRIDRATADRFAADFATEAMGRQGIELHPADKPKSDIYRELLPLVNSGQVELLDHKRLHGQLRGLERRTSRGGRDSIDHAPGQHDDVANAAAGVIVLAMAEQAGGDQGLLFTGEWSPEAREIRETEAELEQLRRELEPHKYE